LAADIDAARQTVAPQRRTDPTITLPALNRPRVLL